jgi:hypothetical protein
MAFDCPLLYHGKTKLVFVYYNIGYGLFNSSITIRRTSLISDPYYMRVVFTKGHVVRV